mmetsp:Transcript_28043/g.50863  ORF Transcript_28043/g.50863 Transcript_28043/m.50863 type:complete len:610 (+) Transcript_28043:73-1902(+)
MLKVAGLGGATGAGTTGPEGILVELNGCRLLVGCPEGAAADLAGLGVNAAELDAVLLTCPSSLAGWPELWPVQDSLTPGLGRRPRLLGTSPLLLAAEAHLQDLFASGCTRDWSVTHQDIGEALAGAEEVHLQQEVTIEGPDGPVLASPCSSGYCLGGTYWVLEAHGVKAAILGPASVAAPLAPLPLDTAPLREVSAVVLHGIIKQVNSGEQRAAASTCLAGAADEAARVVLSGGCVLIPIGADMALALDLVEALGNAIAKLPPSAQAPILTVGGASHLLRRCGSYAEWAHPDRAVRAHAGQSPFLVQGLLDSCRLALAENVPGLAGSFREPCVVLVPASSSPASPLAHFRTRWGEEDRNRLLVVDATAVAPPVATTAPSLSAASVGPQRLQNLGKPMDVRLQPDEVKALLQDAGAPVVVLPSSAGITVQEGSLIGTVVDLCRARRVPVQVDLHAPSARCRLSAAALAVAQAALGEGELCRFDGVLLGHKRPLIVPSEPLGEAELAKRQRGVTAPPLLAGKVDVDAFVRELSSHGHAAHAAPAKAQPAMGLRGGGRAASEIEEVKVPSLAAHVRLNGPGKEGGYETTIEASSRESRRLIAEVLESLLQKL